MIISTTKAIMRSLTLTVFISTLATLQASAAISLKDAGGWLETAWVEWTNDATIATGYNVYVSDAATDSWTKLDNELVRNYGTYGRADALGLKAGYYKLKVVPLSSDGTELTANTMITDQLEVRAHNRQGFAHHNRPTSGLYEGVGAYKNDGTLKDDAIVLYFTSKNASSLSVTWQRYENGKTMEGAGLQGVVDAYRKCIAGGGMKQPLCIRIIGTIKYGDTDKLQSGQGLHVKGEAALTEMPLTIEGVGNDATIYGFGMQVSNCVGTEIRNLGVILCLDDGIEISRDNSNVWVHNMDLFYGQTGSESDKVKGDGAIDIKDSRYCTVSANHFFDCGKCCLVDASATVKEYYGDNLTYCGNWFDHPDKHKVGKRRKWLIFSHFLVFKQNYY